jgi:hypothetical protein
MIHGHPGNGTKAWIWGASPNEQFWQDFGGAPGQNNMFTELQTGVMPTQYQGFPIAAGASREWTEFFTTAELGPAELAAFQARDYHGEAIPAADAWMSARGVGATDGSAYAAMDAWLVGVADRVPTRAELLHAPAPWGGLEQARRGGGPLAPGALLLDGAADQDNETRPWHELLTAGAFSAASLRQHVTAFVANGGDDDATVLPWDGWLSLLEESARKSGPTWLHELHAGIIQLERALAPGTPADANFTAAAAAFAASLALRPTPEAHRNLAIVEHVRANQSGALAHYMAAFALLNDPAEAARRADPAGAALLMRDLAAESAYQFAILGMGAATQALTAPGSPVTAAARSTDRFRVGEVHAAYSRRDWPAFFRLTDCAPARLWPSLGWWGGGTLLLQTWYRDAVLQRAAAAAGCTAAPVGSCFGRLDTNSLVRANPVPFCIRASGH